MVKENPLTPNVSGVDMDSFVSGNSSTKPTKSSSNTKPTKKAARLAKSKDPDYHKLTLYLPKDLINQLKTCVASEADKDVSDVSAELYSAYVTKTMAKMLKQFN